MGKIADNFRKHLITYIISFVVALLIGVAIFLVFYFVQNATLVGYMNGTGVAFGALFGVGTLMWLSKAGAFDTLSYGFTQAFASMFNKDANKYNDMVAYKEDKENTRKASANIHFPFWIASLLFLIAFVAILIYRSVIY